MSEITARLSTALADRYAIERELGEGGMATVYLAEDLKHHRKVAVKVLRPELAAVLGAERFVRRWGTDVDHKSLVCQLCANCAKPIETQPYASKQPSRVNS